MEWLSADKSKKISSKGAHTTVVLRGGNLKFFSYPSCGKRSARRHRLNVGIV